MRTRYFVLILFLYIAPFGCGAPEAEFSYNERTKDLLPDARKAVQAAVVDHFGTPAKMIGWQRLPVALGGVPGVITDVTVDEDNELVTALQIDFTAPKVMVEFDQNLDGQLQIDELPIELQRELAKADANADGDEILTLEELKSVADDLPEEWAKLIEETVSPVNKENAEEYIGKPLMFVNGNYARQKTEVKAYDAENGVFEIYPPLEVSPDNAGSPVKVVLDFGSTLRSGREHYLHHCVHCHGVTGDGNGPTAKYLNPLPRDYRKGTFKFASTERNRRPQRDDLTRVLRDGIPGTYMPSFAMLKDEETAKIVEYVRWLSMRGEYEHELDTFLEESFSKKNVEKRVEQEMLSYKDAVKNDPNTEKVTPQSVRSQVAEELKETLETFSDSIDEAGDEVAGDWRQSQLLAAIIHPKIPRTKDSPESRARGRVLYLQKCAVCHGETAEGDGAQTKDYGEDPITKEKYKVPGLFDEWGQPIQPRNLTRGIYRGGRRPLDIYRRIHQGIPGTPMAPFSSFSDNEIWDIVNYVLSIPYSGAVEQFESGEIARTVTALSPNKQAAN